jgi:dihydroorotase-like cyclic amidohydrolase
MNCDVNIYEGMQVKGRAEYVIRDGKVVIENGNLVSGVGRGKFLFRTI